VNANTPDLDALSNDFEVLGVEPTSVLEDDNGRTSLQSVIGIELRPKHVGDLKIPGLMFAGVQTVPLTLHVDPPDAATSADGDKDFIVDVSIDPAQAYIGQQLAFTVRLLYRRNIVGWELSTPQPNGADIYQLGQEQSTDEEVNGRSYHVIERHYAVVPQHVGALTIPSIEFQGDAVESVNPNSPGSFFDNTSPVRADSSPVTVNVQAPPADWGSTTWLPARALTPKLIGIPADDKAQVGQPINLHMSIEALGLPADALPQLSLPTIDGATVYPDQSTDTTHDDGQWLTGHRERSFAIFPQHPGSLTIPAATLTWFNVQTGQKQVATISAHTLTVLPAAGSAQAASASTAPSVVTAATPAVAGTAGAVASAGVKTSPTARSTPWQWIAIGSIGLWILSAVAFWWRRRRKSAPSTKPAANPAPSDSTRSLRHAFMDAARGNDRATQARRLLAWARSERPELQNLGQLSEALASEEQRAAIDQLQRLQYADASSKEMADLASVFAQGLVWRDGVESSEDSSLPPLYPFKLE
jgi:hypothetical protein